MAYDWVKAVHVIAVISWMAGMLYLPRLFVYHSETPKGSIQSDTFKIMERRLLKAIMTPAMILTWILGLILVWQGGWITSGWLHAKFLLVIALSGLHGFLSKTVREFAADRNVRPAKFYRMINEVPTVLMIVIVILVIVKPF
jgi:protoporphyrinogen IX oxidase